MALSSLYCAFSFPTSHFPEEETEAQRKERLTQSTASEFKQEPGWGGFGLACGLESWDHLSLLPKLRPLGPDWECSCEASARVKAVVSVLLFARRGVNEVTGLLQHSICLGLTGAL